MAEQDLGLEVSQGIAYIRKLQELARSLAHSRPMKALREKVSLNFLARATMAAESVCVLLSAGLEPDARSITRTLAELSIDLRWLLAEQTDERFQLFVDYMHVLTQRRTKSMATLGRYSDRPADVQAAFVASGAAGAGFANVDEFVAFGQAEFERVKSKFPNKSRWTPEDLATRAKALGLEALYESAYRMGSDAVHSSPATMTSVIRETPDGRVALLFGPAEPIDNSTLAGAAWSYLFLVEQCVDLFAAERKPEVAALAEEYGRLFGDNPVEDPESPGLVEADELHDGRE